MATETKDINTPNRLAELKAELKSTLAENETISDQFRVEGDTVHVTPEQRSAFRKNLDKAREIKGMIEDMEGYDEMKSFMDAPGGRSPGGVHMPTRQEVKSVGQMFTESDEFKNLVASGGATMPKPYTIGQSLADFVPGTKDVFTDAASTVTSPTFGRTQREAPVLRPQRQFRVRDLFPVVGTDANLIDYFRVTGFTGPSPDTNNAAPVPERVAGPAFGTKPQSNLTFTPDQAPVRTIAHWEVAHRNVLNDEPQLRGIIDNELLYGLRLVEDDQILNGDGTGDNLRGIFNTPGIQGYTQPNDGGTPAAATEPKADSLRRAATKVLLSYYDPTGYVLHPNDWEDIELDKDQQGRYLITVNVAVGAEQRIWRIPVVASPAMTEGKFLTGAFGLGAQLYDREEGNIRVAEQHGNLFIQNAVLVLAEQRIALTVRRPEAFVNGTFFVPA